MKVLVVTETGAAWPSGFVRALIYKQKFAELGWEASFASRRSEKLTRMIEASGPVSSRFMKVGGARLISSINSVISRVRDTTIASQSRRADVTYLQKIGSFKLFEEIRAGNPNRVVFDLNDGLWLPHWKNFLSGQLSEVLARSDAVTCDNPISQAYAQSRAKETYLVPDPAQVESFDSFRDQVSRSESPKVIGWVGSRNTAGQLYLIWEVLEELFQSRNDIELRLLGTDPSNPAQPKFESVRATYHSRYTQPDMIRETLKMQIGLFPLFDVEDSRARGVLKATIYMSGGACVVASPVGQLPSLIQDGVTGFLPTSRSEWLAAINQILDNKTCQEKVRDQALNRVRAEFSLDECFGSLCRALKGRV